MIPTIPCDRMEKATRCHLHVHAIPTLSKGQMSPLAGQLLHVCMAD